MYPIETWWTVSSFSIIRMIMNMDIVEFTFNSLRLLILVCKYRKDCWDHRGRFLKTQIHPWYSDRHVSTVWKNFSCLLIVPPANNQSWDSHEPQVCHRVMLYSNRSVVGFFYVWKLELKGKDETFYAARKTSPPSVYGHYGSCHKATWVEKHARTNITYVLRYQK